MNWLPPTLPDRFERHGIEFVPLTPALLDGDFAAVMRDIEMLRDWSGQDWPTAAFTAADNLVDLERHGREQRDRVALTYSLLVDHVVQGCVYVRRFDDALRTRDLDPPAGRSADVVVRGWLHDLPAHQLLLATLAFLGPPRFAFPRLWWQTNDRCPQQIEACDRLGLTEEIVVPGADRQWVLRATPMNGAAR